MATDALTPARTARLHRARLALPLVLLALLAPAGCDASGGDPLDPTAADVAEDADPDAGAMGGV